MRIQITGSREFTDQSLVNEAVISEVATAFRDREPVTVVTGGARGADTLAINAVRDLGWVDVEVYPAKWDEYGKRAGYIRNAEMASLGADICLAFFKRGAANKGTQMMVDLCNKAGIPVREIWEG